MNIRLAKHSDIAALQTVLGQSELFPADMLPDMLAPFLANESDGLWLTGLQDGTPVSLCFAEPERLTNGTWNMRAIAVLPDLQTKGLGSALVAHLEDVLRSRGSRVLIVDASGVPEFKSTRRFYRQTGYTEEARIRVFWDADDDKIVFWKAL